MHEQSYVVPLATTAAVMVQTPRVATHFSMCNSSSAAGEESRCAATLKKHDLLARSRLVGWRPRGRWRLSWATSNWSGRSPWSASGAPSWPPPRTTPRGSPGTPPGSWTGTGAPRPTVTRSWRAGCSSSACRSRNRRCCSTSGTTSSCSCRATGSCWRRRSASSSPTPRRSRSSRTRSGSRRWLRRSRSRWRAARVLRPDPAAPPPDLSDLGFPLIVKPHHRSDGLWKSVEPSRKALRIDTPDVFAALWPKLSAIGTFVAQQYVGGPESRIESYHVYVDDRGETAGEFTGHKLRTSPCDCGYTTALRVTHIEDVARCGREIVRLLGLRGVAKLDFKRAPDGTLHLLEVNPRFNLWHHPGARAGVNLPALVFADLTGRPRPPAVRRT